MVQLFEVENDMEIVHSFVFQTLTRYTYITLFFVNQFLTCILSYKTQDDLLVTCDLVYNTYPNLICEVK